MKKLYFIIALFFSLTGGTHLMAQYCVPTYATGCTSGDTINDFIMADAGLNHMGSGCSPAAYGDFTGDPALLATVEAGESYAFSATHGFGGQWMKIWIDFDGNGSFEDSGELLFTSAGGSSPTVGSITIPGDAESITTRMRVMINWNQIPIDSCTPSTNWGEVHDYTVEVIGVASPEYCIPVYSTGCTSGDTIDDFIMADAGINHIGSGCSPGAYGDFTGDPALLATVEAGESYAFSATHGFGGQWMKIWIDFDGNGSFEDSGELLFTSAGGSSPTVGSITIPGDAESITTRMRVMINWNQIPIDSCTPSTNWGEVHDYTVEVIGGGSVEYCDNPLVGSCTWDRITNVTFVGINNTTPDCVAPPHHQYLDQVANVTAGESEQISVTIMGDPGNYVTAFIDWNQNGTLNDPGEVYELGNNVGSGTYTMTINVPNDALSGQTRMRVKTGWEDNTLDPCQIIVASGDRWGEMEDYTVEVAGSGGGNACTYETISNGVENGTPNSLWVSANDFIVPADESFTLEQVVVPILTAPGSTILFGDLTYYNNSGSNLPGTTIGSENGIVPTSQTIIGNAFGFDVREVVLDVTPFTFDAGVSDTHFWVRIHTPNSFGNATYWETNTTGTMLGYPTAGFDGTVWTYNWGNLDGVFQYNGQCSSSGGGGGDCEWEVHVWGAGFGDEVSWFLDEGGTVILSGGPYGLGFDDLQTVMAGSGPMTFYIESLGPIGDNTPSYTVTAGGNVVVSGTLVANTDATYTDLMCDGGGGGDCEWEVHVWDAGFGDEVSWFLDEGGTVILSGGPYGLGFDDLQTVMAGSGPMTFYIESLGPIGDNTPSYTVTAGGDLVVSGTLVANTDATYTDLMCDGGGGGGDCEVGQYNVRADFEAAFSGTLNLEDFAGGPGALVGCDGPFNNSGNSCFAPGEILPGISITTSTPSEPDPMVFLPTGFFGNTIDMVGSNQFSSFTIIEFPDGNVDSFGFDLIALVGGGNVEIRIYGATSGLLDTFTVNATSQTFFGYIASEILDRVELEDPTLANVELIGMLAFGQCGDGGGGTSCDVSNPTNPAGVDNGYNIAPGSGFGVATDIVVGPDEDFTIDHVVINVLSTGISTVDINYYNDNAGLPGTIIGSQAGIVPTSANIIGTAFGWDIYEVVMDVTPFTFSGQPGTSTKYWLQPIVDTFWEVSYATVVESQVARLNGGVWALDTVNFAEAVYFYSGECTGGGGGTDCSNPVVDINQDQSNTCMAFLNQTGIAQSFTAESSMSAGAGFWFTSPVTGGETLVVELYDNLPNGGGVLLASGSTVAPGGDNWVDVFWTTPASTTVGNMYYLVVSGSVSACMGGTTFNSYPGGHLYANAGYGPFPDWDYTFRHYGCDGGGGGGDCEWEVHVWGAGFGDEVSWYLDEGGTVILSGGPYGLGFDDLQTVMAGNGPMTFYIESIGTFNDNTPNYTVTAGGNVLVSGTLIGGTDATYTDLMCDGGGSGGDCEVGQYNVRADFEAAFSGTLNLEDFAGGPGALVGCDGPFNNSGNSCFAPGEILPGISITTSTPSEPDPMVFLPTGLFGNTIDMVGSNQFASFTIIEFPDGNVDSFGFDLIALVGGGNVEIRIYGATSGLLDTFTVNATSQTFFGYIASEILDRVELEDPTLANVELIGMLAFGQCEGGGGGGNCDETNARLGAITDGLNCSINTSFRAANDITVPADNNFELSEIKANIFSIGDITNVNVHYYENGTGNLPGTLLDSETGLSTTSQTWIGSAFGLDLWEIVVDVSEYTFNGQIGSTTTYWIQLELDNVGSSGAIYWETTIEGSVGYPAALFDGGWMVFDPTYDGVYVWVGNCEEIISSPEEIITGFTFYPNPADHVLYLQADKTIESVELYNVLGQKVLSQPINSNTSQIDVSGLSSGAYLMVVQSEGVLETYRVIKK